MDERATNEVTTGYCTNWSCQDTNNRTSFVFSKRRSIFSDEVINYLDDHKRVEADDGYLSGDSEFVKNPSGIHHPDEFKDYCRRVMGRQETINGRNKNWGALS